MLFSRLAPPCALWLCLFVVPAAKAGEQLGLRVPDGFRVSLFADDDLAHDIYSMTIDSAGRVVVSGHGYIKVLHDDDHDGRAESATLFSARPASGCMGMYFDGRDLVCTGDGAVMRLHDSDGDGVADGQPDIWTAAKFGEHGAHAVVRGPDGCFYVMCGNDAGIGDKQVTSPESPVKHPRCGTVVRFNAAGQPRDVYAHGLRNPYDFDFNAAGQLFTVDSDGERDHHLPWYAPTRLFDLEQGQEHGWVQNGWVRCWSRPQSFFDSGERLAELGRGSPTGVAVYRHRQFPAHYHGGVLSACWTLGRIYFLPLVPSGSSYRTDPEIFVQSTGDTGFAPCDLAVGPEGDLFVAIGGRHTRGGVFRIHYDRAESTEPKRDRGDDALRTVLAAQEPLSSWSRARWVPLADRLGAEPFAAACADESLPVDQRVRAVEILTECFEGVWATLADDAGSAGPPELRARLAWALGRREPDAQQRAEHEAIQRLLARWTADRDPRVARAAWEALAEVDARVWQAEAAWRAAFDGLDHRVRSAAILVAQGSGRESFERYLFEVQGRSSSAAEQLAALRVKYAADVPKRPLPDEAFWITCLDNFFVAPRFDLRLEAVRLLQLGLGDVNLEQLPATAMPGYDALHGDALSGELRQRLIRRLAAAFPTDDAELNRELARLLGMLHADMPGLPAALATRWTRDSSPQDDIHYLIVAGQLPGDRAKDVTLATAKALLALPAKTAARGEIPGGNWPARIGDALENLTHCDPQLPAALLSDEHFGAPADAMFISRLQGAVRQQGIERLREHASRSAERPSSETIELIAELTSPAARTFVRRQWDDVGLRDTVVVALARQPEAALRPLFVEALGSAQPSVVRRAAEALLELPQAKTTDELAAAIAALRQACTAPDQAALRGKLAELLRRWSGQTIAVEETPGGDARALYAPWLAWFAKEYPAQWSELNRSGGEDLTAWRQRLARIDWAAGAADRGQLVFERRACHRCHRASGQLGPDLRGALARMSRDDVFTAIIDPNREISPTFQATLITTASGQVYQGLIVYDSPEGILVQTGPDKTVRITETDGMMKRPSRQSLMPVGLLNQVSDAEIADLYAYLKTLSKP